ncbi:hypothetical protein DPV24_25290 [Escherichia coli]|nr:hypothetical protein [Escherichia coli]
MAKKCPRRSNQHYNDGLASSMRKSAYSCLHGINTKTFWQREPPPAGHSRCQCHLPPATIAAIIWELHLCEPSVSLARPRAC